MQIGVSTSLTAFRQIMSAAPAAPAIEDMLSALTVAANGWELNAKVLGAVVGGTYSGLNDKAAPGLVLKVSSPSWTVAGVSTTRIRYVYTTGVVRKPYPNGTDRQETTSGSDFDVVFSLSSRILASDTVVSATSMAAFFTDTAGSFASNSGGDCGAVINSSTLADYEPQAVWLNKPLERITGSTYTAKLFVNHRFAQQGQPVRAVKFTATDESLNSVSVTVSALTTGSFVASGLYSNWFQGALDFSGLTPGEEVTLDATIYPWVGAAYTISVSGETYPSANLAVHKVFYDPTAATIHAYVDPINGNNDTGVASNNEADAIANKYSNIRYALAGAETANGTINGRANVDGCVITIAAGSTVDFGSAAWGFGGRTWGKGEVLIRGVNRATSVFINEAQSTTGGAIPGPIRFQNMTLSRLGGTDYTFLTGNNLLSDQIVYDEVTFGGSGYYDAWAYECGRQYFFECDGINIGQGVAFSSADKQGTALAVGCSFVPRGAFNWVACDTNIAHPAVGNPYLEAPKGAVIAHSFMSSNDTGDACFKLTGVDMGTRGAAVVGNVLEVYGASTQPGLELTDSNGAEADVNFIEAGNTVVGGRTNLGYNQAGTTEILRDVVSRHSVHMEYNSKGDYFGTNGNLVGNWGLRHGVDGGYRFIDLGQTGGGTTPAYAAWLGEALGDARNEMPVGDVVTGNPDFADDQSGSGGSGGGDYTPGVSTDIPQIPAGETMFAVDLYGTAVPTDGTAYAGAVQ